MGQTQLERPSLTPKRLFVACNNSARVGANTCGLDGVHGDTRPPDCNGSLRLRPNPAPTLSARKTELDSSAIGLVVQCVIASVDLLFNFGGAVEIRFRDQNPNAVDSDAEWDISISEIVRDDRWHTLSIEAALQQMGADRIEPRDQYQILAAPCGLDVHLRLRGRLR